MYWALVVYKGIHTNTGEYIAVMEIRSNYLKAKNPRLLKRVLKKPEIMENICEDGCRFIINMLGVKFEKDDLYTVTELANLGSLEDQL